MMKYCKYVEKESGRLSLFIIILAEQGLEMIHLDHDHLAGLLDQPT